MTAPVRSSGYPPFSPQKAFWTRWSHIAKFIKAAGPMAVEVVESLEKVNAKGPTAALSPDSLRILRPLLVDHWRREAAQRLIKANNWSTAAVTKAVNRVIHDMWVSWHWHANTPLISESNSVPPASPALAPLPCLWPLALARSTVGGTHSQC